MEKNKKKMSESDFEEYLDEALKSHGFIFPETDEQVDALEENMEQLETPEELDDPDFVFGSEFIACTDLPEPTDDAVSRKNWAIAARIGKEIPKDILERMKKDKAEAKKKKNGNK